jgi:inositol 1,4,5-triphosphate receptor type 1/inositol 1,4,5-triphosphate receptor type 3
MINYMHYNDLSSINNYRDSLFVVLPSGMFDIHDEYLK